MYLYINHFYKSNKRDIFIKKIYLYNKNREDEEDEEDEKKCKTHIKNSNILL
jgi:ribosomal protein S19